MAVDFKTLIGIEYDLKQAKKETLKTIKELQNQYKAKFDMELSDKDAKASLNQKQKALNNERQQRIQLQKDEINAYKLNESYKETARNKQIADQKQIYLDTERAYILNQKFNNSKTNLGLDKVKLNSQITTWLSENSKATDTFTNRLRNMQFELKDVDTTGLKLLQNEFDTLKSEATAAGVTGKNAFQNFIGGLNLTTFINAEKVIEVSVEVIKNMISEVKNLDSTLVDLQMATGYSQSQAKDMLKTYIDIGQQMGSTATEVSAVAIDYLKQGKSIAESNELIKDSLVLAKIGNIDNTDATTFLTTTMNGYKVAVSDVIGIVDKLSAVDLVSTTDAGGLAEGMSEVANNASLAGIEMDKLLGYLAVIGEKTDESMSSVGASLNTIFSRMGNIKLDRLKDTQNSGEDLSNVETDLGGLGINLRDDSDTFRNFGEVLDEVGSKWNTYSDISQQALASALAGTNNMEQFLVLMENYGTAMDYSTVASNSFGTAMDNFSIYEQSVEAKTNRLAASFQELANNTIDSGFVKGFLDLSNGLVNLIDNIGLFNIALVALSAIIGNKTPLGLNIIATSFDALITKMGVASGAATTLSVTLGVLIPIGIIVGGIALFNALNVTLEEQKQKLNETKTAYEDSKASLESINEQLKTTFTRMDELNKKENLTFIEQSELDNLRESNKELLIQQDILEKQTASRAKEVAKATEKTYDKQFGNNVFSEDQISSYISDASISGNNAALSADTNDLSAMIAAYKQFTDLKNQSFSEGENEEFERYNDMLSDISLSLYSSVDDLIKYKNTLSSIPFDELSEDQKNVLSQIDQGIELVYTNLDPAKWKEIKFGEVINTSGVQNAITSIRELSQSEPITEAQIMNIEVLNDALTKSGLTAEEFLNQINASITPVDNLDKSSKETKSSLYALASAAEQATGYVNDLGENVDITNMQDAISKAQSSVEDFKSILTSMDDNGGLTVDSLDTITQKYPQMLKYVSNEKELREQVQKSIDNQKKTIEDYYKSVLEMDNELYTTVINNNTKCFNKLVEYYGTDITNWKSLAQAKADIDGKLLTKLNEKWSEYYSERAKLAELESNIDNPSDPILKQSKDFNLFGVGGLTDPNADFLNKKQQALKDLSKEAMTAQGNYDDLKNLFVDTDYTTNLFKSINKTSEKSGDSDSPENIFSEVFDWISIRIDKLKEKAQKSIDDVRKHISFIKKNKQLDVAIGVKIDEQNSLKALKKSYEKKASDVGLSKKYQELVNNGGVNIQTITNEKLANKINEYQKWKDAASDVGDELSTINDNIKELNSQKLDNITDFYNNRISFLSSNISSKESTISYKKNAGKDVKESDYNYLLLMQKKIISYTKKELDEYSTEFNEQIKSGEITITSPEYYEGKEKLNELTAATREARSSIYDYKAEIRELRWKSFDDGITKISNTKNELSDLADLIKDSDVLDDKGNYTQEGLTKLGLLSQQMAQNNNLVSEYSVAINALSKELKNGDISQELYNEELANYQNLQRQAVKDNQALENSIAEISKQRIQYEIDAINKETDAFKELIDTKKKSLQAEKDLYDYQTSINKKQKSIETLQRQIGALKLSTDRKDIAQKLKLEEQLREQQTELEKEQLGHSYDVQMDAYDNEYDAYKKTQDEKISSLEKSLEDQETLIKSTLDEVFSKTTEISTGIQTLASEHGLTVTQNIITPWESATSAIEIYKQALASIPSNTNINTGKISSNTGNISDSLNTGNISDSLNTGLAVAGVLGAIVGSGKSPTGSTSSTTASKLPISTVKYTGNKSSLNKDSSAVDRLKYFDLDSSLSARGTLYKYFGLTGSYTGTSGQNTKLISAMKKSGFSQGGKGKLVNSLEDEGFALLKRDETTLSSEQTEQFKSLLGCAPIIKTAIDSITGNTDYTSIQNTTNPVNVHYDNLITVQGNVDGNNIKQLEYIAQKAVEQGNKTLISLLNQKR